jgi:hypothetical protein
LGQLKKLEPPFPQDSSSRPIKMIEQVNKIEEAITKRRKVLYELDKQKNTGHYPVFKPLDLSGFQIGDDSCSYVSFKGLMQSRNDGALSMVWILRPVRNQSALQGVERMLLTFRVILSDRELEVLQLFGKRRSTKSIFRDS